MSWGWKFKAAGVGTLEVDWVMTRGSNQYFPISEVIVKEPSNVCIRTVLHECILTICTSHAALSETRANQCLCKVLFLILVWLSVESKNQKPNIPLIQSLRCQLVPTNRRGFAPRLLCMGSQRLHFCNSIMLLEKYTLKTRVSWYGMVFQCIVTIFLSDSCLAGCPKLSF